MKDWQFDRIISVLRDYQEPRSSLQIGHPHKFQEKDKSTKFLIFIQHPLGRFVCQTIRLTVIDVTS